MRPVDYDLVDRLERARYAKELAYVCPFWDWLKDFRDRFTEQGWWVTTRDAVLSQLAAEGNMRGLVLIKGGVWRHRMSDVLIDDECSGEIDWR